MRRRIAVLALLLAAAFGAYLLFLDPSSSPPPPERRNFMWSFDMEELTEIRVSLPREDESETWVKRQDDRWHFAGPDGSRVDPQRWGGGVPLLASGPGTERVVVEEATDDQLDDYGFVPPVLRIDVTTESGREVSAEVGDATPNGQARYIRLVGSRSVYTVHYSWYEVLAGLVSDPPYPDAADAE